MNNIVKEANREINRLTEALKMIEKFQKHEPKGCLVCRRRNSKPLFYHQYIDGFTGKKKTDYIRKKNASLAGILAQKQYYALMKPIILKDLRILKSLVSRYQAEEINKVYEDLSPERKELIVPIKDSREEAIWKWNKVQEELRMQDAVPNSLYSEKLRFKTGQGEFVRSKSEVIIANMLYEYKDKLMYAYEQPLVLRGGYGEVVIHPDFTIINLRTGKITYYEHFGLMDNPEYANDFVRKIKTYSKNNYVIGRDVIFTCETLEHPLDVEVLRKLVEEIVLGEENE